jgi:hypothetical protein
MHNAYAMPTDFAYTQCLPAMHTHLCLPTLPTHLCPPTLPTHLCLPTYAYPHCLPSYAYPQCLPTYAYSQCLPTYAYPQYLPTYAYPQYLPTYAYSLMPTHAYAYPRRRRVVPKARNNLVNNIKQDGFFKVRLECPKMERLETAQIGRNYFVSSQNRTAVFYMYQKGR